MKRYWKKGGGIGEGEIIEYALKNSNFLFNAENFAKCTSKLWVSNFDQCLKGYNGKAFFTLYGGFKPKYVDTRFYIVNIDYFKENLSELHRSIDDKNGLYLEVVFGTFFRKIRYSDYLAFPAPMVYGVSGTTGRKYNINKIKNLMKNIRLKILHIIN